MRSRYISWFAPSLGSLAAIVAFIYYGIPYGVAGSWLGYAGIAVAAAASILALVEQRRTQRRLHRRRIFIVYAKEDLIVARDLYQRLEQAGLEPWMAAESIAPGEIWHSAIFGALENSAVALVLVSKHLAQGQTANAEIAFAMQRLKAQTKETSPIVPVLVDETPIPREMAHIQYVSLADKDSLPRLLKTLKILSK